ncbi:high frequency of lysogenization c family protein [Vibrio phage Seahorse]|uniref:High frequency of lysogenization c family protein n=1 Tax=Vibrio phage Seahorse TaxID=2662136 RepID=A0A6B7SEW5_9CAUD|nr:high frequency of lysogenization c family protein [Vibrio phage Seahorse]QGF21025.1 high frequency of lysogenization c family protein [Vibrio phage Seahorse]
MVDKMTEKKKYVVNIPWNGVEKGQVVEFEKLHPALKANVSPYVEIDKSEGEEKAKSMAEQIIAEAKEEAEKILADAKKEAESTLAKAKEDAGKLTPATPDAKSTATKK